MKASYRIEKFICCCSIVMVSNFAFAKGLGTLQATDSPEDSPAAADPVSVPVEQEKNTDSNQAPSHAEVKPGVEEKLPAADVQQNEPGLKNLYLASGLSYVKLTGKSGSWQSTMNGDIEVGRRAYTFREKFQIFGTLRYRPVDVDVSADGRAYSGVTESYLVGAKAHLALNSKATLYGSGELGLAVTHLDSADNQDYVDSALEKSGLTLELGGGITYLTLDKIGIGPRISLGIGSYKTLQFGLDLRFML